MFFSASSGLKRNVYGEAIEPDQFGAAPFTSPHVFKIQDINRSVFEPLALTFTVPQPPSSGDQAPYISTSWVPLATTRPTFETRDLGHSQPSFAPANAEATSSPVNRGADLHAPAGAAIVGTSGDDTLTGTLGSDSISGLAGDDVLEGLGGADVLNGGEGTDYASYENANSGVNVYLIAGGDPNTGDAAGDTFFSIENLRGSAFNDLLFGDAGDNTIEGGAGDDTLYGWTSGTNRLFGGDGVDNLVGGGGIDIMDGGANVGEIANDGDTVSYQLSSAGLTASLRDQSINTGDAAGDVYIDMEDLTGTAFNDVLHGDDGQLNNLWGLAGDDHLIGYGGTDVLIGDAGADILDGGDGIDIADYETADAAVIASLENPEINTGHAAGDTYISVENLAGTLFDDILYGDGNNNVILGWPGSDQIFGGDGDDGLEGMGGADFLDGGAGIDTAGYSDAGLLVAKNFQLYTQLGVGVTASLLDPSKNTNDAAGDTYANIENLQGSTFADFLEGDNNNNTLFGLAGNDTLEGEGGDDVLEGGAGADALRGGSGTDIASYSGAKAGVSASLDGSEILFGDAQGDSYQSIEGLLGSSFGDVLAGDDNFNVLQGGGGNDTLRGRGGDDLLEGGAGADTIDGGDGVDVVTYENATSGVTVALQNDGSNTGDAQGDILINVEVLQGSRFNDILKGFQFASSQLRGGDGDDQLIGGAADDILIGGAGADQLVGGEGRDLASYVLETGPVTVYMSAPNLNQGAAAGDTYVGIENLAGTDFGDILGGDDGNNVIFGRGGNDFLYGGGGDDSFEGGDGADFFDGQAGIDVVSYANEAPGVTVFLAAASLNQGAAAGDNYQSIENLIGSSGADILGGTDSDNVLFGEQGNDFLYGGAGDDLLEGGAGSDFMDGQDGFDLVSFSRADSGVTFFLGGNQFNTGHATGDTYVNMEGVLGSAFDDLLGGDNSSNVVNGGAGNDYLIGAGGDDILVGGSGNDILYGGLGNDVLDGGDGLDVAYYREAESGVIVDFTNRLNNAGEAALDDYINVENIWGSDFGDVLTHDEQSGQVYGFAGNDQLFGNGGDDNMYGGAGADIINGGAGADTFFHLFYDSEGGDTIQSFVSGEDRLFVSRFWFGISDGGPASQISANAADFITDGVSTNAGKPAFIYDSETRTLSFDPDGEGGVGPFVMATFDANSTFDFADIWSA